MSTKLPFQPADILIPRCAHEDWACVACDQFTSQRAYWERAYAQVGDRPSCLHIILPEVYLDGDGNGARIAQINAKMREYMAQDVFEEYRDAMIYVERSLSDGSVRRGIVGAFSLDDYSYEPGAKCRIRPTEGTVLSRIPPRVAIRRDAPLELPHIMIFMDDRRCEIIEGIDRASLRPLYDFPLMLGGGRLRGWLMDRKEQQRVLSLLARLEEETAVGDDRLLFAVGDGNHSLASAKAAAVEIGTDAAQYALAELVNIHGEGVSFEPIYRVLFDADVPDVLRALADTFRAQQGREVTYISRCGSGSFRVDGLETDVLQRFLDAYASAHPQVRIDYIHGEDTLRCLAMQENAIGFLYGGMRKEELFPYVRQNGILPRKTFSVGQACDKRYYMEARKIR